MDGKEFHFKKKYGQNFLQNKDIINKMVSSSDITDKSLIIEIGPGKGALTKELIKTGANVLAYEIDLTLKEELEKINGTNLKIIFEDFLKSDVKAHLQEYKYERLLVIANLPYYITTPIIEKIIKEMDIYQIVIMIQKEVANRFMAKPNTKEYNSLSIYLQYYFDIEKVVNVSKNNFYPVPNVDSIVIKLTKHNKYKVSNEEIFFKLIRDSFKQKRKNLRNNLKEYDLVKIENVLKTINKDLTFRAEQLTIEDFIKISNDLYYL